MTPTPLLLPQQQQLLLPPPSPPPPEQQRTLTRRKSVIVERLKHNNYVIGSDQRGVKCQCDLHFQSVLVTLNQ